MVTNDLRRPRLRLTRRGRIVVLGLFIMMASFASAILLTTASRAEDRGATGPAPTVVVQPHDTLWSIATRTAPRRDPYAAIADIRRINDLAGYVVHPGQTLELPR
jgi:hypothetical protein